MPHSVGARYSVLSFTFAAVVVCHCILLGESAPPRFNATTWSITYPGQAPVDLPVAGQACTFLNESLAATLRAMRPCELRATSAARLVVCVACEVNAAGLLLEALCVVVW
jgi:hypothetical protein